MAKELVLAVSARHSNIWNTFQTSPSMVTLLCEIAHVDLIWCDIQGAERNMIAGGRQTLARTSWLLTECYSIEMYEGQATRDELLHLLGSQWALVAEWPENANLLLRNRNT
jgi:2-O-methyltransferase